MFDTKTITADNAEEVASWCQGKAVTEHDALDHSKTSPGVNLLVDGEVERASMGDTIIKKDDGTFKILKNFF